MAMTKTQRRRIASAVRNSVHDIWGNTAEITNYWMDST